MNDNILSGKDAIRPVFPEKTDPTPKDLHPTLGISFSVFYAPITNIVNFKNLSLLEVYRMITSNGYLKKHTDALRSLPTKKEQDKYKVTFLPCACFSGIFSRRLDNDLIRHSGLICIDIDHVKGNLEEIRCRINALPQTIMSFVSPSGTGLKVVFPIDLTLEYTHRQQYLMIAHLVQKMIADLIGMSASGEKSIDTSCANLSRACLLPYDPACFLNPTLKPM